MQCMTCDKFIRCLKLVNLKTPDVCGEWRWDGEAEGAGDGKIVDEFDGLYEEGEGEGEELC